MKRELIFPVLTMILNVGSFIGYGSVGNKWMAIYWALIFGINYIVAFKLNIR